MFKRDIHVDSQKGPEIIYKSLVNTSSSITKSRARDCLMHQLHYREENSGMSIVLLKSICLKGAPWEMLLVFSCFALKMFNNIIIIKN